MNALFRNLLWAALSLPIIAFGAVTISTDWQSNQGPVKPNLNSLNLWSGMDPTIAANTNYKAALNYTRPNLIRYHAGEQTYSGSGRSWIDANGNWVEQRIKDSVSNTRGYAQTRLVTITGWPVQMRDPNNSPRLDPAKFDAYASWCAQLATIMKNNAYGVTYYEPFNESEDPYLNDIGTLATIFTKVRNAIKAVDPSAKVGGPVFKQPWNYGAIDGFLNSVGTGIDFFSYHHYASGTAGEAIANIYNSPISIASRASEIRLNLRNRGLNIPLMLTEQNMFYSWEQDQNTGYMRSSKAAVFDALMLKYAAAGQDLETMPSWNDADYTYGKFDPSNGTYAPRTSAHFMKLAREHLNGESVSTTSSDVNSVLGFATYNGTKHCLVLINRSGVSQAVNTSFAGGWAPSTTTYTEHRISSNESNGYASSSRTWSGAPQNVNVPAHSVYILQFTSGSRSGGEKPFGGTARSLTSRIQAEDYNTGGQDVAYYDRTFGNSGGAYRTDRVDILPTADTGGGYAVSETEAGEALNYTVNVPASGTYNIKLRASSYWGTSSDRIRIKLEGVTLATVGVPQTWNDDGFTDVNISNVTVSASSTNKKLRLEFNGGGLGLNWIEFVQVGGPTIANGTYKIIARHSGKSLDVEGVSTSDGADVHQWSYVGGNNQKWTVEALGGGDYKITAVHTGKALTVSGGSTTDGAQIEQWSYTGSNHQKWNFQDAGGGYFRIVAKHSGKCAGVSSSSTSDGAKVIQWTSNGSTDQQWQFLAP